MSETKEKQMCKYGAKCYQKNSTHLAKFNHPTAAPNKKHQLSQSEEENEQEVLNPPKRLKCDSDVKPESKKEETSDEKIDKASFTYLDEDEVPEDSTDIRKNIEAKYLVKMPNDFFDFWKSLGRNKKLSDLLKSCGLQLVGPFDVIAEKELLPRSRTRYLCHWRFYYDPPEFQTVLVTGKNSHHVGYFRDSPSEVPSFLASMDDVKPGIVTPEADNIFDAIRSHCEEAEKSATPFKKPFYQKLSKEVEAEGLKEGYSMNTKAKAVKQRKAKVVCKSFHGAGIVVPVDKKTEVGYREVPETDASLRKMFKAFTEAKSEESRKVCFSAIQELMTNAQWANDEGDFGMSLELGMAMFISGSELLHKCASHLMGVSYSLLDREHFATILKAHLKNRRKGSGMSAFPSTT